MFCNAGIPSRQCTSCCRIKLRLIVIIKSLITGTANEKRDCLYDGKNTITKLCIAL